MNRFLTMVFALIIMTGHSVFGQCPTSGTISANCTTTGNLTVSGNTLTINSGVIVTITGNLRLNNNAAVIATGAIINIAGDFNEGYGTLNTLTGGTINLTSATSDFKTGSGGSFTLNGSTVAMNGGVISLNNDTQTLIGSTFTGAGSMDVNVASLIINDTDITTTGDLEIEKATITNGSKISAGDKLLISSGASTVDNSEILSGTQNANTTGQEALEFNGGGSLLLTGGTTMNVRGDLTDQRNLTIDDSDVTITGNMVNSGGDVLVVRNNGSLTVQGDFTNGGGSAVEADSGGLISVEGDFSNTGGSSVDTDGGVVIVGGSFSGDAPTGDGTGCTGGSGSCCGSAAVCSTLPVSLLTFEATVKGFNVTLNWKTAEEQYNDFFTIERSFDGLTFNKIAKVNGSGTVHNVTSYQYVDKETLSGKVYYRLTQSDFDGTTEKLRTVFVNIDSPENFMQVYPTKLSTSEDIFVMNSFNKTQSYEAYLIDIKGGMINSIPVEAENGKLSLKVSEMNIEPGVYLLKGHVNQSGFTKKIIVE